MVIYVLVLYPEMAVFDQKLLGQFIQEYYRCVNHYDYDLLWAPGKCFGVEQLGVLHILRFTISQIYDIQELRILD